MSNMSNACLNVSSSPSFKLVTWHPLKTAAMLARTLSRIIGECRKAKKRSEKVKMHVIFAYCI